MCGQITNKGAITIAITAITDRGGLIIRQVPILLFKWESVLFVGKVIGEE